MILSLKAVSYSPSTVTKKASSLEEPNSLTLINLAKVYFFEDVSIIIIFVYVQTNNIKLLSTITNKELEFRVRLGKAMVYITLTLTV